MNCNDCFINRLDEIIKEETEKIESLSPLKDQIEIIKSSNYIKAANILKSR